MKHFGLNFSRIK